MRLLAVWGYFVLEKPVRQAGVEWAVTRPCAGQAGLLAVTAR